eukprot:270481_1
MAVEETEEYSSIVSIIYFSINIIFLIALGAIVYNQGGHTLKSKSYFKDIWNQRKIYAPLIIHFYDTATDIGVIYSWYLLMRDENDYQSVDMEVFFWTGVSFLAVYRVCLLCWSLYDWLDNEEGEWYHVLLVLVDLYIFVAVYESFMEAQEIITSNARKRRYNAEKKQKARAEKSTDNSTEYDAEEEIELDLLGKQFLVQLGEVISESLPQIVLQSVFIIRSANDALLVDGSDIYLIMLSVIGSLLSISNKYVFLDKHAVCEAAKSLKPRERFPGCIQYLYVIRVIWRMFHITSRFCVFVLIWTVLGGAWLPIWSGCVFIFWNAIHWKTAFEDSPTAKLMYGTASCIGIYFESDIRDGYKQSVILISCGLIQSLIGWTLITIFGVLSFNCDICSDPNERQIFNNKNDRVLLFWTLGIVSSAMDIILFFLGMQNIYSPLYMFLKTELCTSIGDENSRDDFDEMIISGPGDLKYVSENERKRIFMSIMVKVNHDKAYFTREEYMNWVQSLTRHKLHRDILN